MEAEFNSLADTLIADDRLVEAVAVLETAIREMPSGWKPSRDDGESVAIAFWDHEEFRAYLDHHGEQLTKLILWESNSYFKAWHQLAAVAVEDERFENALFCLDCGIALESDHPELWSEKGMCSPGSSATKKHWRATFGQHQHGTGRRILTQDAYCVAKQYCSSIWIVSTKRKQS
jgi:hypothetical protein